MYQSDKELIYLYDLPKNLATSVKIASIIRDKCEGYELPEPVQFKDCKPNPVTGVASPFMMGMIKVDKTHSKKVAEAMKYFKIDDGSGDSNQVWECRALPFDRDLLGANKNNTNTLQNVFVKGITPETSTEQLDKVFTESFGEVKSAKISRSAKQVEEINANGKKIKKVDNSVPPVNNGYGFVCFQNAEVAQNAVA